MQFENRIKRFITIHIPVYACNFRCSYCYVGQHQGAYQNGIKKFCIAPDLIAKSLSPERLGGYCYFNLCGLGETTLHPQLFELVSNLTSQGHFVDIITNGVLRNKLIDFVDKLNDYQKAHLFIKFSFHYLELKEHNLQEVFFNNVKLIEKSRISFSIEITPHDELVPYIDEIKTISLEKFGALPHITVARNEDTKEIALLSKYTKEEYDKIWGSFGSPLFDFKLKVFNEKRNEFCYAGEWSLSINLLSGDYKQCYCGRVLGNIMDLERPINFVPIGKCRLPHCYNAHAFLAWGNIPELNSPSYNEERDRLTVTNEHWLKTDCRDFFETKLFDNNKIYRLGEKRSILFVNNISYLFSIPKRICNKICRFFKGIKK